MSKLLLRAAAGFTLIFALGHSMGATHPRTEGAAGVVVAAMKGFTMEVFGAQRSYWDFYNGYGYTLIVVAFFFAVLLWLLSLQPIGEVRKIAFATAAAQVGIAVFAFEYFFWAPGVCNAAAAALTAIAAALP
jgi:hypothetical protein